MKGLAVFWLALGVLSLSGCATLSSMEELERQAMLTGDWSAVEQRERILTRRAMERGAQCPSGAVSFCESYVGRTDCRCISNEMMRDVLASYR